MKRLICALILLIVWPFAASAQDGTGQVQLPLDLYQELLAQAEQSTRPAPASYALGQAVVTATVQDDGSATVNVRVPIEVLEDEWILVPVVPSGTAIVSATVSGRPAQFVPTPQGLMWAVNTSGTFQVDFTYRADSVQFDSGRLLALPLPPTPSSELTVTLPESGSDVTVIPAVTTNVVERGSNTIVTATVPSSDGVQVTWGAGVETPTITVSRATYTGVAERDAVTWQAEFTVELGSDGPHPVNLVNSQVALLDMQVDGNETPISIEGTNFVVSVEGRGTHTVSARFQSPIDRSAGHPSVQLDVFRIPVSQFELRLEGEKEVTVTPASSVQHTYNEGQTTAVVHVPMTSTITFGWLEAVPDSAVAETEVRANATVNHLIHAEEGVLYIRAATTFDVTRGETSQFGFRLPESAQINRIDASSGGVADWRRSVDDPALITVFLDRQVSGEFSFDIYYEQLFVVGEVASEIEVPLLAADEVHRQRGMIALLASRDLTLEPSREERLNRVGENQLPAFLRESITMTIAHTFRYFEESPELAVRAAAPERQQGRFDAQVDTLISLGDVTTVGRATIEINVKQGSIDAMQILLPPEVNFLNLTAPSLRERDLVETDSGQRIDVEFTRDMEGQFRVDVTYERITSDNDPELSVPLIHVEGAEVEQGRIAVEALSAVEVSATGQSESLSTIDISELPQQLIMRTTNPILLAFKYPRAEPIPQLVLTVTKHTEIEVQAATIDSAHYRTLYTADGFTLTTCNFVVRNSREQFLRVRLPADSEVWSATVNGSAEAPALAIGSEHDGPEVLINIINSAQGFPVELIYATQMPEMGSYGSVEIQLPRPDMVVTRTSWDVLVPEDYTYDEAETNMEIIAEGVFVGGGDMAMEQPAAGVVDQPIRIQVPESGLRFTFEKLYANQVEGSMFVSLSYVSTESEGLGLGLSVAGTILLWLGFLGLILRRRQIPLMAILMLSGAGLVGVTVSYLHAGLAMPIQVSAGMAVLTAALLVYKTVSNRLKKTAQTGTEGEQ